MKEESVLRLSTHEEIKEDNKRKKNDASKNNQTVTSPKLIKQAWKKIN